MMDDSFRAIASPHNIEALLYQLGGEQKLAVRWQFLDWS